MLLPSFFNLIFYSSFKVLDTCWEEHPVSSHLLPSSTWNKGGKIFSDWVYGCDWPLLCFYPTAGSWKNSLKEPAPMYINAYLSICQSVNPTMVQIFWNSLCSLGHQHGDSWILLDLKFYFSTASFFTKWSPHLQSCRLYLLSWYCKDLSLDHHGGPAELCGDMETEPKSPLELRSRILIDQHRSKLIHRRENCNLCLLLLPLRYISRWY